MAARSEGIWPGSMAEGSALFWRRGGSRRGGADGFEGLREDGILLILPGHLLVDCETKTGGRGLKSRWADLPVGPLERHCMEGVLEGD